MAKKEALPLLTLAQLDNNAPVIFIDERFQLEITVPGIWVVRLQQVLKERNDQREIELTTDNSIPVARVVTH